mmetsp:Transcript_6693/g.15026  ORF Transcript_6693/g.15026 Transcript_6693/m.15026 type:complete len:446 (+) Transcript_6693:101-1438(+)
MSWVQDSDVMVSSVHIPADCRSSLRRQSQEELLKELGVHIARRSSQPPQEQESWKLASASFPKVNAEKLSRWKASLRDPKIKQELTRLLSKTLIFADTLEAFREAIVDQLVPIEYAMGQVVFRHGEPGNWLGILITGRMERKLERMASEISIGEIGPGGIIGDLGLFGINPHRSFTVLARTHCEMLVLSQKGFEDAVQKAGGPTSLNLFRDAGMMQNLMADAESFVNLQCFNKLDRNFVMTLRENSEPRLCYNNQVLMKEGHYGDEMYILRSGKVKIEKGGKFVVELPSGVVLGELAVLGSDKRRTATVTCTSLCLIRALHADVFHEILEKFPGAKRVFDHAYVARLVSMEVYNAKEELNYYDTFFGSAMPRTGAQLQEMLGGTVDDSVMGSPRKQGFPKKQGLALPNINGPARRPSAISATAWVPSDADPPIRASTVSREVYKN